MSRVLKTGSNQITCAYAAHCANVAAGRAWAKGIDVVKYKSQIDKITAHSAGRVLRTVDYLSGTNGVSDKAGMGYGNYIMILHENNYVTLYAHLESVYVSEGQTVNQGDIIGLMGNTGNSFGAHLHFEVRKYKNNPAGNLHDLSSFEWLDPTEYLDASLPSCGKESGGIFSDDHAVKNDCASGVKTGAKIILSDVTVYGSENGSSIGKRSGIYFVWSDEARNSRIRMTNSAARVGVKGQVSFWASFTDIQAACGNGSGKETASTPSLSENNKETNSPAPVKESVYTVKTGDSLWAIAAKLLGSGSRYKEIKSLNGLKDDVIYAGQVLKMPE